MNVKDFKDNVIIPANKKLLDNNAKGKYSYVSFVWLKMTDNNKLVKVGRMMKGIDVLSFENYINENSVVSIEGPFKTKKEAQK